MAASTTSTLLRQCLDDVDYPADKDHLVQAALGNGCDDNTARALRAIPATSYRNLSEVLASVDLSDDDMDDAEKAAARRHHTKPGLAETDKDVDPGNPIVEELGENRYS